MIIQYSCIYVHQIKNKQNFTLQSTYERTYKKQTLLLFKVLRITLSSDQVYGELQLTF